MRSSKNRRELIPVYRCTACGKEMTDGLTLHWLYCPAGGGRMVRVGVAEDEDDESEDSEDDDEG